MKNWYTADLHLEHPALHTRGMREHPWGTMEQHDAMVIHGINSCVGRGDRLTIVGDFAMRNAPKWRQKILCKNVSLVIGNHDRKQDSRKAFGQYAEIQVSHFTTREKVVLCHYPMAFWPSAHHGAYHLYGHVHSQKEVELDEAWPDRRSMDVGLDNASILLGDFRPFSEDEILWFLRNRQGHDPVEQYRGEK